MSETGCGLQPINPPERKQFCTNRIGTPCATEYESEELHFHDTVLLSGDPVVVGSENGLRSDDSVESTHHADCHQTQMQV